MTEAGGSVRLATFSCLLLACVIGPQSLGAPAASGRHAARAAIVTRNATAERPKTAVPSPKTSLDAKTCASWERTVPINPFGGLHVGLKTYAQTLQLQDREIVLTFDDGPWPATTPAVLDALKNACAHATFFLIGRRTEAARDLARRERDEGHTVGHHSLTHPTFTLRGYDDASAKQDLTAGIAADEQALYGSDGHPERPHVPFFRFPGFADTPALLDDLDTKDFAVFGTDLWAFDWMRMSPGEERELVLWLLDRAPHHNGILLFHDDIRSTAEMLPGLLRELRRRHYTIAHLVYDPKAAPPSLTAPVKGWTPETSETERIIQHLDNKIVPGSHRFGEPTDPEPRDDAAHGPR